MCNNIVPSRAIANTHLVNGNQISRSSGTDFQFRLTLRLSRLNKSEECDQDGSTPGFKPMHSFSSDSGHVHLVLAMLSSWLCRSRVLCLPIEPLIRVSRRINEIVARFWASGISLCIFVEATVTDQPLAGSDNIGMRLTYLIHQIG